MFLESEFEKVNLASEKEKLIVCLDVTKSADKNIKADGTSITAVYATPFIPYTE